MKKTKEIKVVKEFFLSGISEGDSYTFDNQIASHSIDYTHGIHTYPAKFIPQIPRWAFKYALLKENDIVFDPFTGCGTTMVEARLNKLNSYGTEINPLGRLMSHVKSNSIFPDNPTAIITYNKQLISKIKSDKSDILLNSKNPLFNFPEKWEFWFPKELLLELMRIKKNILGFKPSTLTTVNQKELKKLKDFYLITLSSIMKKASYFDERQIKVRFKKNKFVKETPNVLELFRSTLEKNTKKILNFISVVNNDGKFAEIVGDDAQKVNLNSDSVDFIVTSPPYINAIDYPMAHKYNLFLLDLVHPNDYKTHCRRYAGMTERAVKSSDYYELKLTGYNEIDRFIKLIYSKGKTTDKNRAFILFQYFSMMKNIMCECHRILKNGKKLIIVVGDNRIRGEYITTAKFIELIALDIGFKKETSFKHYYKNVRLKINRHKTGGKIDFETVLILLK